MNSAVINIKTDPNVKKQAQEVAKELGLNLSIVINGFLKHLIKTKTATFSAAEEPSDYMIKALKESEQDIKAGRVSPRFDNAEDAIAWLKNPKKKYVDQIQQKIR